MDELMAVRLPESVKFTLAVAIGTVHILDHLLGCIDGIYPRSPLLEAAVAVVVVALPITFIMAVVLMYVHLNRPAGARQPRALRRSTDLACALAFALVAAILAFLFLALDDSLSPDSSGFRPT